jgi:hypothetical protein
MCGRSAQLQREVSLLTSSLLFRRGSTVQICNQSDEVRTRDTCDLTMPVPESHALILQTRSSSEKLGSGSDYPRFLHVISSSCENIYLTKYSNRRTFRSSIHPEHFSSYPHHTIAEGYYCVIRSFRGGKGAEVVNRVEKFTLWNSVSCLSPPLLASTVRSSGETLTQLHTRA